MIIEYHMSNKEKVTESMRCATVLGFGRPAIVELLQGASYAVRNRFTMMEDSIREATTDDADVMIPGTGSDAMDVSAIGIDKKKCGMCGKGGHSDKAC
eukprot:7960750-Karenia_brevis.AAC.1